LEGADFTAFEPTTSDRLDHYVDSTTAGTGAKHMHGVYSDGSIDFLGIAIPIVWNQ
jgi:hypothetical protein